MNNIKFAREAKGLSQKEIAIHLGVSGPTVSEWETGKKNPLGKNLMKLSDLLGVSVDYLLGRTQPTIMLGRDGGLSELPQEVKDAMMDRAEEALARDPAIRAVKFMPQEDFVKLRGIMESLDYMKYGDEEDDSLPF